MLRKEYKIKKYCYCHFSTCYRGLRTRMKMLLWKPVSSGSLWQSSLCVRRCSVDTCLSKNTQTYTQT